jgi:adhesin/invasin
MWNRTRASSLRASAALLSLAALSLSACSKDSTSPLVATSLSLVSGNSQSTTVGLAAAAPLIVSVADQNGSPLANATVTWAVASGGGTLSSTSTTTDSNGQAQITYTAATTAGTASVTATVDALSAVTFTMTLTPDVAAKIAIVSGDAQSATIGAIVPQPFVVAVTDQYGNAVPGVTVIWATDDDGTLSSSTTTTDALGQAQVTLTFGTTAATRSVTATVENLNSVVFSVSGS